MSKKFYRFLVLYTLSEDAGNEFINNVRNSPALEYKKLTDQSSFTVSGDSIRTVKQLLKQAIPNTVKKEGFFVNLYYSAVLADIKQQDKRDYIVEDKIWPK